MTRWGHDLTLSVLVLLLAVPAFGAEKFILTAGGDQARVWHAAGELRSAPDVNPQRPAEPKPDRRAAAQPQPLRLVLSSDRQTVAVGEAVTFTEAVENTPSAQAVGRIAVMPKKPAKPKPVPKSETLKIEGDWQDAVKKALQKKKPATGWPKPTGDK